MECPVHAPVCAGTECRPKLTVTAGSAHACALTATGELWCWGDNARGQLGAGDSLRRGSSLEDPPLVAVDLAAGELRGVSAGGSHTCAWLDDGSVRCWGGNSNGELGLRDREDRGDEPGELGTALPVVDFGPVRAAIAVSAGGRHTCALFDDGAVKCWGANESGQRGLGHVHAEVGAQGDLPSVDLGPEAHVIQIDAGEAHTCALLAGGRVKCWGSNEEAQLGIGSVETRGDEPEELGEALPSVALPVETPAVQVSAGDTHSCALLADGEVWCWGSNTAGQLGTGTTSSRGRGAVGDDPGFLSVDLGEGVTALAVSAGANHSCALLADRRVKCWGINQFGALGIGERSNSRGTRPDELGDALPSVDFGNTPLLLAALVSAGVDYTCASLGTEIKCFGVNTHGQLGIGDNAARGDNPAELGAALPPVALPAP
jgi:alpha-tubulin suppressor-like RCC1 family protein